MPLKRGPGGAEPAPAGNATLQGPSLPAPDSDLRNAGLPLSPPAQLVDGVIMLVIAAFYGLFLWAGFAGARQVSADQHHLLLMAVVAPSAAALWWRRRYPLPVLAVALAAAVFGFPIAPLVVLIALYSAAPVLHGWRPLMAWTVAAAVSLGAGSIVAQDSVGTGNIVKGIIGSALAVAVGLWIGVRRDYLGRLHERALFARALASFLAPEVAELVKASPSALSLQGEVEVTVLFSDIRGFSTFAEQAPPRRVVQVVGRHLAAMAEVVRQHGGMLDKFAGDAVMAVFGAPKPLADHAARAVACAVAMQQRQADLNRRAPALDLPCTSIGIGVNSGTAIAGLVGGAGRLDYTVIGDTVNLAQRLESTAAAGEILASAATAAAARWPSLTAVGSKPVKGRQQPVDVCRVDWQA